MTIVRKLEDQKVSDGAVISIECELSRHNVDVKWTKASYRFTLSRSLYCDCIDKCNILNLMLLFNDFFGGDFFEIHS